jgi:DNA-binding XRE family transcriptional regulator
MTAQPPDRTHYPTPEQRQLVQLHATVGTTQETIADILGIDSKTLRKHYREELDQSTAKANAQIGGVLFNKAKGGDTAAMIFWMKTRAGWRERHEVDHQSSDGSMSPTRIEIVPGGTDSQD